MVLSVIIKRAGDAETDVEQCVGALFDVLSQEVRLGFVNRKCLIYTESESQDLLILLTHISTERSPVIIGSLITAYPALIKAAKEYVADDCKDKEWSLVSWHPTSEASISNYMVPYPDVAINLGDPHEVIAKLERHSTGHNGTQGNVDNALLNDHHSALWGRQQGDERVELAFTQETASVLASMAYELCNADDPDEERMRIIGVAKHVALEMASNMCVSVIAQKYGSLPSCKGTVVDIACYLESAMPLEYARVKSIAMSLSVKLIDENHKTPYDHIASLIYIYTFPLVVCTDVDRRVFYVFSNGWKREIGASYFHRLMIDELSTKVARSNLPDVLKRSLMSSKAREIIVGVLAVRAESRSFEAMLDSKTGVMAMANCVYDTVLRAFRKPHPCDYLTMSTHVSIDVDEASGQGCEELISILRRVFPDPDVLDFWLTTVSLCLAGRNKEKLVPIWIGKTDSAKSTCQKLIEATFGDYAGVLPASMLTDRRPPSHGTTSALSSMTGKRIAFLQEPEDYRVNSAQLKSLSGNDRQYTREIFEKAKYMAQSAIVVVVSNGSLDLTRCDEAALSRIVVIPFSSTFITSRMAHRYTGEIDGVRVHLADPGFEDSLHRYTQQFFYILTIYYNRYMDEGLTIPQVIREHTDAYIMKCNPMLHFIKTHVMRSDGSVTNVYALYELFKDWMRRTSPAKSLPSMHNFLDDMRSNGLEPVGSLFHDITTCDDDGF